MDERLVELETRLSFQDDLLTRLDAVVVEQRQELDRLQLRVQRLEQQLQQVAPSMVKSEADETPPPHY